MFQNRLEAIYGTTSVATVTEATGGNGFMVIPAVLCATCASPQASWNLHRWAYERARAILTPSWIERDVLGVWN
ncbi:MAG TPA: hypothetical protein VKE98_22880 [Gemmataceae bacterium]|nr:hypothetical protein [Gemmataceae bacterium]